MEPFNYSDTKMVGVKTYRVRERAELARVNTATMRLPTRLRETLILRTVEGLGQAETADVLGISEKAVETRLYRARSKLSELLANEGGRKKF